MVSGGEQDELRRLREHHRHADPDVAHAHLFAALDPEPLLEAELLGTLRWAADYYHHPIGEVLSHLAATVPLEERTWLYLLRLAAFILILVGILLKNRRAR